LELIKNFDLTIEKVVKNKNTLKDKQEYNSSASSSENEQINNISSSSSIDEFEEKEKNKSNKSKKSNKKKLLQSGKITTKLAKSFKTAIHLKELKKLQKFNEKFRKSFEQVKESL